MAWEIGRGDAVICPSFTYHATAEMVALLGATPIIADVAAGDLQSRSGKLRARRSRPPASAGLSRARSFRSICSACRPITMRSTRSPPRTDFLVLDDAAQALRRDLSRPQARRAGDGDRDQLLSGEAARLLRRRRRGLHRRRRARGAGEKPAPARRGRRSFRGRAHRHYRPARHHPGGGADRKAENFPGRDRRAQSGGGALFRCACRVATVPRVGNESTSVWAQYTLRLEPGRRDALCRRAESAKAFRPRSITPSRCIASRPIATSRSPTAACRSASNCRRKSSACRCMPISSRRSRTASSTAVRRALAG